MPRRKVIESQRFTTLARDLPGCRAAIAGVRFLLERIASFDGFQVVTETPSGPMFAVKTLLLAAHASFVIYFVLQNADVYLTAVAAAVPTES